MYTGVCKLKINGETCGKKKPCHNQHDPCMCLPNNPCDYHAATLGFSIR